MSKQCYWSSGARRRDWSVNSLRCWRCLVINTPDETPSKAHPSFTGSLLLLALLLSVHQALQCFLLLAPDTWLHCLHLVWIWSYLLLYLSFICFSLYLTLLWGGVLLPPFFVLLPSMYWLLTMYLFLLETSFIFPFPPSISVSTFSLSSHCFFLADARTQHLHLQQQETYSYLKSQKGRWSWFSPHHLHWFISQSCENQASCRDTLIQLAEIDGSAVFSKCRIV